MKTLVCAIAAVLYLLTAGLHAQSIESKLAGSTFQYGYSVLNSNGDILFRIRGDAVGFLDGKLGLGGVLSPWATLHLGGDGGIIATGTLSQGSATIPSGDGTRLLWYPRKAAFRAGYVSGTQWNDGLIGLHSAAFGNSNTSSGEMTFTAGALNTASGSFAAALGSGNTASGNSAMAFGMDNTASGAGAVALGGDCSATGMYSVAMGFRGNATATGAMIVCDNSNAQALSNNVSNRLMMRFDNGYYLYSNSACTLGVRITNHGSSWSSVSDSTKKNAYRAADADAVLQSFRTLRLGSWNYIGDDQRHYGPMAQEWFAAFGHDGIGVIGDDTSLASADVDGVLCIAVQALEQRTSENLGQVAALRKQLEQKDREIEILHEKLASLERENQDRYAELKRIVMSIQQDLKDEQPRQVELLR